MDASGTIYNQQITILESISSLAPVGDIRLAGKIKNADLRLLQALSFQRQKNKCKSATP